MRLHHDNLHQTRQSALGNNFLFDPDTFRNYFAILFMSKMRFTQFLAFFSVDSAPPNGKWKKKPVYVYFYAKQLHCFTNHANKFTSELKAMLKFASWEALREQLEHWVVGCLVWCEIYNRGPKIEHSKTDTQNSQIKPTFAVLLLNLFSQLIFISQLARTIPTKIPSHIALSSRAYSTPINKKVM